MHPRHRLAQARHRHTLAGWVSLYAARAGVVLAAVAALTVVGGRAEAQTQIVWRGGTGLFNVAGSWNPLVAPSANTTAVFSNVSGVSMHTAEFFGPASTAMLIVNPNSPDTVFRPNFSSGQAINFAVSGNSSISGDLRLIGNGTSTFRYNSGGQFGIFNQAEVAIDSGATLSSSGGPIVVGAIGNSATLRVLAGGRLLGASEPIILQDSRLVLEGGELSASPSSSISQLTGNSLLEVRAGTATFDRLSVSPGSSVRLAGGTLDVLAYLGQPGQLSAGPLNFDSGTLRFRNSANTADFFHGGGINVSPGKRLTVDQELRVDPGSFLTLNGGPYNFGRLAVLGGTVFGAANLDLATRVGDNRVVAHGNVNIRVRGNADSRIVVPTDTTLAIGDAQRVDGYGFQGVLEVQNADVILADRNRADLGRLTILNGGSRLAALNGINLANGQILDASSGGDVAIDGDFTNNGIINGPSFGVVRFNDDVNGAGRYTGNVVFFEDFSPGNGPAVSTAAVTFDGNLQLAPTARINLELESLTRFDQLVIIGNALLDGFLNLSGLDDYEPVVGDTFTLLDIAGDRTGMFDNALEGQLFFQDSDSPWRLSYFGGDGNDVVLTVVPEPGGVLLGVALLGLASCRQRRRPRAGHLACSIVAVGLLATTAAQAQTQIAWRGGTGLFNVANSWDPVTSPNVNASAVFTNTGDLSHTANFTGSSSVGTLLVVASSPDTVFRPNLSSGQAVTLAVSGDSVFSSDFTLTGNGSSTIRLESGERVLFNNQSESIIAAGATLSNANSFVGVGQIGSSATLRVQAGGRVLSDAASNILVQNGRLIVEGGEVSAMGPVFASVLGNNSLLEVRAGTATFRTLRVAPDSSVRLTGGTLVVSSSYEATGSGNQAGPLHFDGGTLRVRAFSGVNTADAFDGGGINLSGRKTLIVDRGLRVDSNSFLGINGVTLDVGSLVVSLGTVFGNGVLNLATSVGDNQLIGEGTVGVRVTGNASSRIVVPGNANLTIGDTRLTDGYAFPGVLEVVSGHAILLDSNRAQLGVNTTLSSNGRLSAPNGINLSSGQRLTATGAATIAGDFTNNGTVTGPAGSDFLRFNDNVDGAGSYSGNVTFLQEFSPGNSPAVVSFGGDLRLGPAATLNLELESLTRFDQLRVSGDVSLDGFLNLSGLDGYEPIVGDAFTLLDIAGHRTGMFDNAPEGQLFFQDSVLPWRLSYLGGDGNDVVLTVVPEPGFLAALVPLLATTLRRRRGTVPASNCDQSRRNKAPRK